MAVQEATSQPVERAATQVSSNDNVATTSLAYRRMSEKWPLIDDLYGKTQTMREAGRKWLPQRARERDAAYTVRLGSSFLYPALADTIDAVANAPFVENVRIEPPLPEDIADLEKDIDGEATSLTAQAAEAVKIGGKYGMCCLLVDFPVVEKVVGKAAEPESDAGTPEVVNTAPTRADEKQQNIRPTIVLVSPKNLLSVTVKKVGAKTIPIEARIKETSTVKDGQYGEKQVERIRVIGESTWEMWELVEKEWKKIGEGRNSLGKVALTPFYMAKVGTFESEPTFEDIAWLNVAHWQSSSLQRNSLDMARIPILVRVGFTDSEKDESNTVSTSMSMSSTNPNAKVAYCEHTGAAIAAGQVDLEDLRKQMQQLGMKPWMQQISDSTAAGVKSNDQKSDSEIVSWVRELEAAYLRSFEFAAEWMKIELEEGTAVKMFDDLTVTNERQQDNDWLLRACVAGKLPLHVMLTEVRKRGTLGEEWEIEKMVQEVEEKEQEESLIAAAMLEQAQKDRAAGAGGAGAGDGGASNGKGGSGPPFGAGSQGGAGGGGQSAAA